MMKMMSRCAQWVNLCEQWRVRAMRLLLASLTLALLAGCAGLQTKDTGGSHGMTEDDVLYWPQSEDAFDSRMGQGNVALVFFTAPTCGPCEEYLPTLREIAIRNLETVTPIVVDLAQLPGLARRFRVVGTPTMILVRDGSVKRRWIGSPKPEVVNEKLNLVLEAPSSN
mgnify:CR=1 FL=1